MTISAYFRSATQTRETVLERYGDLALVAGIVAIVALMVLPLPLWLIDLLVAANIASGIVLLLLGVYIATPLEFSVFPSVLLMTTLFRLSLSVATTRMILLHGNGGHIIDTFGKTVAGGNLVVGLVVFLIITLVQFIVIAKGAERVAEVAARFSLDAMPGKQLSIDSDLRSGLIDKDEARRRRRTLEQESKLHGSLDGAMKFVKGDAIAGIVIIIVNLLGGLAVGVLQQDMAIGDAMHKYSILTIGEGMVAQIPALLGAMAAGLIVTRATDEERDRHLGDAMRRQLSGKPRVLIVAAAICALMAVVPGFPVAAFLALAATFLLVGLMTLPVWRSRLGRWAAPAVRTVRRQPPAAPRVITTASPQARPSVPLLLELPDDALDSGRGPALAQALEAVLDEFQLDLGLTLPRISLHAPERARDAAGDRKVAWRLLAFEVPVAEGSMPRIDAAAGHDGALDIDALASAVREALRRHAALFIGIQETTTLLTRASMDLPDVVKEVLRALPMQRVAEVLKRLVSEEVSIRNLRDILETLSEAGQREKDVHALTEFARIALKRQISHRVAPEGVLHCVLLAPDLEDLLRQSLRTSGGVTQLALETDAAQRLNRALVESANRHHPAAIVTAVDVRWHVRKLIEPDLFDTPVLSYHELMPTLRLEVEDRIGVPQSALLQAA